jgi:hypothetical protein
MPDMLSDIQDDLSDDESEVKDTLALKMTFRDDVIKKMCQGKPNAFQESLLKHESLLREEIMKFHEQERAAEESKMNEISDKQLSLGSVGQLIRFESRYSLYGYLAIIFYCITHLTMYQIVESLILEQTRGFTVKQEIPFYLRLIVISILVLRFTGGIWEWVSPDLNTAVMAELKNRKHYYQDWDTKIQFWFQKRRVIRILLNYIAFYVCLVAMVFFQHQFYATIFHDRSWIYENLPSRQHEIDTSISRALRGNVTEVCTEQTNEECSLLEEIAKQDDAFFFRQVTLASYLYFKGYAEMYLVSPFGLRLVSLPILIVGIYLLEKLGFDW